MPRWVGLVLARIHRFAALGKVQPTAKAFYEAEELRMGLEDITDVVLSLRADELSERRESDLSGEWMYVFHSRVGGRPLYVKLILRDTCVVISFHEDNGEGTEDNT